ncbi:MAG: hypothetical protein AB8F34_00315 [Akkermansiaceae bacterium]
MPENPYQSPITDVGVPLHDQEGKSDAPPVVVEHLRGTRPWVKFCSLSGYITALFVIIIDVITIRKMLGHFHDHQIILLGVFYLILAILFIIPSIRLSRYEKSITRLTVSNRIEDLEQAIAHQRAFWKQMGIMILITMVLYLITIGLSAVILLSGKI